MLEPCAARLARMETATIRPCPVAEILQSPNLRTLLDEYADESALAELGPANPQIETYCQMEELGLAHAIGAFYRGELVGFIFLIISTIPHFGRCAASTESFFVSEPARKSGAGLRLLHEAEELAKELGAVGIYVSSPSSGRLAKVLPGVGYRETNRLFFRGLQ